jgi:hypothetical protein
MDTFREFFVQSGDDQKCSVGPEEGSSHDLCGECRHQPEAVHVSRVEEAQQVDCTRNSYETTTDKREASLLPCAGKRPNNRGHKIRQSQNSRNLFPLLLPMAWHCKMDENVQFNCTRDGLQGLIEYAERLETSKACFDGKTRENSSLEDKSQGGSHKPDDKARTSKFETGGAAHRGGNGALPTWTRNCLVHGEGCGHPSHKCKVLMDHAGKVKGQFKASYKDKNDAKSVYKKSQGSKPWQKPNKEQTFSKKEVQAILKRANEKRKESEDSDEEQDRKLNQIGDFLSMTEAMSKMELVHTPFWKTSTSIDYRPVSRDVQTS